MICHKNPFLRLEAAFLSLMFLARATHSFRRLFKNISGQSNFEHSVSFHCLTVSFVRWMLASTLTAFPMFPKASDV